MITLQKWKIDRVLGQISVYGVVEEDTSGRYRKFDHVVLGPLTHASFDERKGPTVYTADYEILLGKAVSENR